MCFCVMVVVGCIEQTQAATDVLFGCSWNVRATIALHLDVYPTLCMAVCQKKGWKKQIRCGLMVGWWLDYVILKVFSSLYGSMLELFFIFLANPQVEAVCWLWWFWPPGIPELPCGLQWRCSPSVGSFSWICFPLEPLQRFLGVVACKAF